MLDLKVLLLFCSNEATVAEKTRMTPLAEAGKKPNNSVCSVADLEIRSNSNCDAASFELQESV